MMSRRTIGVLCWIAACALPTSAGAQFQQSGSYTDWYRKQVHDYKSPGAGVSARNYTIDKHFYHNPNLSPYLNLTRRSGPYSNNYYQYVRTEQKRRAMRATPPPLKPHGTAQPRLLRTAAPSPAPLSSGHYRNHWYGSRQSMGLNP